jgi:hypothetical protein
VVLFPLLVSIIFAAAIVRFTAVRAATAAREVVVDGTTLFIVVDSEPSNTSESFGLNGVGDEPIDEDDECVGDGGNDADDTNAELEDDRIEDDEPIDAERVVRICLSRDEYDARMGWITGDTLPMGLFRLLLSPLLASEDDEDNDEVILLATIGLP